MNNNVKGLITNVFDVLEMPFFVVSYPDLRFFLSNGTNNSDFLSLLSRQEVNEERVIGKAFDEIITLTEDTLLIRNALEKAGLEKKAIKLEPFSVQIPGGQKVYSITCFPLPGESYTDKIEYVAASVRDISCQSKVSEQEQLLSRVKDALEEKEALLSSLNGLPLGVIFYSKDHIVRYVNDSVYWLTGYEKQELLDLGKDQIESLLFGQVDTKESILRYSTNNRFNKDALLINKFQQHKPVELYHMDFVKMGRVGGSFTVIQEKVAETDLLWYRTILHKVLETLISIVIITDSEQKVFACSKSVNQIYDLDENQIIGRKLEDVWATLGAETRVLSYQTIEGKKYVQKVQVNISNSSHKRKTFLFNHAPLLGPDGNYLGQVQVGSDMTSYTEKQDKLIENERLAVIGRLTSSIAHEIKNPLTVISGFAEVTKSKIAQIVDNDSLKESMLYYQQEIVDNSQNMNKLIVDLLHLARPKKVEKVSVRMSGMLEKICNTISPYALQKNVTLTRNLEEADLEVAVDPGQVGQVLLNLCNNAIQAMTEGGTLNVTTERNADYVVVKISDTGCGIPPEDIPKLGTPFYTTKAEGTGLGLSVAYSIVKDYDGKIEVESKIGKGTTFKVYFPLEN